MEFSFEEGEIDENITWQELTEEQFLELILEVL